MAIFDFAASGSNKWGDLRPKVINIVDYQEDWKRTA
jgi:hypothetical protein